MHSGTPSETKIIGGERVSNSTDQRAAFSTVRLLYYGTGPTSTGGECTGTVIGPGHIVTAAHCIKPISTLNISAPRDKREFEPIAATAHPDWDGSFGHFTHDIGVISFRIKPNTLSTSADSVDLMPLELAEDGQAAPGSELVLAGFGDRNDGHPEIGSLYQVRTSIHTINIINSDFEIAQGTGKGPCNGDSGDFDT